MQWFIDMILALANAYTDAQIALHCNGGGLVNRGDPPGPDFGQGDLICDGTWRDLDLSGIVPAGAVFVLLRVTLIDNLTASYGGFRTKGNVNWPNAAYIQVHLADTSTTSDKTVALDSNRKIQYTFTAGADLIQITVAGWSF